MLTDKTPGICSLFFLNNLDISLYVYFFFPIIVSAKFTFPFFITAEMFLFFGSNAKFVLGSLNFLEKV